MSERKLRANLAKVQYEREIEAQRLVKLVIILQPDVHCLFFFFCSRCVEEEYQALVEEEMERMTSKRSEPKARLYITRSRRSTLGGGVGR